MAEHITDANIASFIEQNSVVVVDFSATWCGPCKALAPIVEKVAEAFAGRALVGKADIEESPESAEKYRIRSVPTIVIIKNGEVVDKIVGLTNEAKLTAAIEKAL